MLLGFLLRTMFVMKSLIHLRLLVIEADSAVLGRGTFLLNLEGLAKGTTFVFAESQNA